MKKSSPTYSTLQKGCVLCLHKCSFCQICDNRSRFQGSNMVIHLHLRETLWNESILLSWCCLWKTILQHIIPYKGDDPPPPSDEDYTLGDPPRCPLPHRENRSLDTYCEESSSSKEMGISCPSWSYCQHKLLSMCILLPSLQLSILSWSLLGIFSLRFCHM